MCAACTKQPEALNTICRIIQKAHIQHAKALGMTRCSTRPHPKTLIEHVNSLCNTPNITWAAYMALYGEHDEALEFMGGPSTVHRRAYKRAKTDSSQTRYLVQWGYT